MRRFLTELQRPLAWRTNPSQPHPSFAVLGRSIRRVAHTDEALLLMDRLAGYPGMDFGAGGCWLFASSLVAWSEGAMSLWYLLGRNETESRQQIQHAVAYAAETFFDLDGASSKEDLVLRWMNEEGLHDVDVIPGGNRRHPKDWWCSRQAVEAFAAFLRTKLGPPARWGLAPRMNPSSPSVTLPAWVTESENPIEDYVEEEGEVPDEATLLALIALETKRHPNFMHQRVVFGGGQVMYTGRRPAKASHYGTPPDLLLVRDENGAFDRRDPDDFLQDLVTFGKVTDYFDPDPEDRFNDEFWESPVPLLHGTSDLDSVLAEGLEARSESRGLGNRNVGAAVFATTEESVAESYGNHTEGGIVTIDTKAMKRDGYMPRVGQEPEVLEQDLISAIAHKMGMHHEIEYGDAGIDPDTIIIYGDVPAKYILKARRSDRPRS